MLIAFDIGNTTVAIGLFDGQTLVQTWRISSDRDKTSDEYGLILRGLLDVSGQKAAEVREAIGRAKAVNADLILAVTVPVPAHLQIGGQVLQIGAGRGIDDPL